MSRIRIAAAGVCGSIVLFISGAVAGSAMAQTATSQPLQLLKVVERPKHASKPHAKIAAKSSHHSRLAAKATNKPHRLAAQEIPASAPAQPSEAPASASPWPQANSSPSADVAAADPLPAPADQMPRRLVVGGQTVQIAAPDEVNAIDLAANDSAAKADVAQTTKAAPENGQASASLTHEMADADPKADLQKIETAQPTPTKVGSTSWILQVMAALGGAVTAGSLAWFLIGSTPQRTYG